ncbi:MAG: hypothetical protein QOG89_3189, partial [Thermomicrobiales bacterium]|nr:hypothetical protein [Thermomicrobiales bacterium]
MSITELLEVDTLEALNTSASAQRGPIMAIGGAEDKMDDKVI